MRRVKRMKDATFDVCSRRGDEAGLLWWNFMRTADAAARR
jgi:hypothetical protein